MHVFMSAARIKLWNVVECWKLNTVYFQLRGIPNLVHSLSVQVILVIGHLKFIQNVSIS